MAWIKKNPKALERQPLANQTPQLTSGGTWFKQREPLAHHFEIKTGEPCNVIGSGSRQVMR